MKLAAFIKTSFLTYFSSNKNPILDQYCSKLSVIDSYIHGPSHELEESRLQKQAKAAEKFLWKNLNISDLLPHKISQPFLEIGCGVGAQTPTLIDKLPKHINIIGIDIDSGQIDKARKFMDSLPKYDGRYEYFATDASSHCFESNSYSGAYISWVLEHLGNDKSVKLLSNLRHAIHKDGIILINEIIMEPKVGVKIINSDGSYPNLVTRFLESIIKYQVELGGNPNFGQESNIKEIMLQAGLENFFYRQIEMVYSDPESVAHSRAATKEIFQGIASKLDDAGLFPLSEYPSVENEIDQASNFTWHSGQVLVILGDNKDLVIDGFSKLS